MRCTHRISSVPFLPAMPVVVHPDFGPIRRPTLRDPVGNSPVLNEPVEVQAWSSFSFRI
jgi:hypothetical protein